MGQGSTKVPEAAVAELGQLVDGPGDDVGPGPPLVAVELLARPADHDVLVDQRAPEIGRIDRTRDRLHLRHALPLAVDVRNPISSRPRVRRHTGMGRGG